jgi:hypothetical protein
MENESGNPPCLSVFYEHDAAKLMLMGFHLKGVKPNAYEPDRKVFYFKDTPEIRKMLEYMQGISRHSRIWLPAKSFCDAPPAAFEESADADF